MATNRDLQTALEKAPETKPAVNTLASLIKSVSVRQRFDDMLGKKAAGFMSSILTVTNSNKLLQTADPMTIISAAAIAASLDLPINPSLGFAYIVPYFDSKLNKYVAQFQMGWRGYVQLAQRTGLYRTMNAGKLYEGQLIEVNLLTGDVKVDPNAKKTEKVEGYFAYFELINGFKKTMFIHRADAETHAKRYSQTYKSEKDYVRKASKWTTDFDAMATKTAVKSLLGRWAPLSADYQTQKAITYDQSVVNEDGSPSYPDNEKTIDAETADTATGEVTTPPEDNPPFEMAGK